MDDGVLQTDILELGVVFEEPPVGDIDFYGSCIEQRIVVPVLYECVVEEHLIEKGEVDAADLDGGMKVMRKAGGHFGDKPGLDGG